MNGRYASFEVSNDLTCLLVHPGSVGMLGAACQVDATAAQLDKEKHVQRPHKESLHREAIAGQDLVFVMAQELAPDGRTTAFKRRQAWTR